MKEKTWFVIMEVHMIYAKCIRKSQLALSKEEFISRQNEPNNVYCVGETTKAKIEDTLYCVPLNYIFCCLKYGDYIAVIDYTNDVQEYPRDCYLNHTVAMSEQTVIKVMKAQSREAIDYVAEMVKDHSCIEKSGYIDAWFSEEYKAYFMERIPDYAK